MLSQNRIWGSRFAVTLVFALFLAVICGISLYKGLENIALKCIDALMILVPTYILGDTIRRSGSDFLRGISNHTPASRHGKPEDTI